LGQSKLETIKMKLIENRNDIRTLVNTFYSKIRKNELLGPIFNGHIPDDKWEEHLSKLTDFWETNLFGVANFGMWLQLWFATIDELFEGETADKAKNAARKMSTGQYISIWNHRPEHLKQS
jgi:hemoglobin